MAALCLVFHARGQENGDASEVYRLTLSPYGKVTDDLGVFGRFGFAGEPEAESRRYDVRLPGINYSINSWLQIWAELNEIYTANQNSANTLELRPSAGPKLLLPNQWKWIIYNYTRYEYEDTLNLDTHQWSVENRIRSRFGVVIPLTSREQAWLPRTWYAIADVEPFYRFDKDEWDPLRVRGGIGYVIRKRLTVEFIYMAQFTSTGSSLEHTENVFRLNFKIGFAKQTVDRMFHYEETED